MANFCKNCGAHLEEGTRFCPECGHEVKVRNNENTKSRTVIIVLVATIAMLAAAVALSSDIFSPDVPLESRDFELFRMDVPVGSECAEF